MNKLLTSSVVLSSLFRLLLTKILPLKKKHKVEENGHLQPTSMLVTDVGDEMFW